MNQCQHFRIYFQVMMALLMMMAVWQSCWAEGGIVTDGTVGITKPQSLKANELGNIDISEKYGTPHGGNLFHSFSQFNIAKDHTVTFNEDSLNTIENVIARVTGNSRSDIDGTLSVTPGGTANFFLINPNGIILGPNSTVTVPGSIHLSTADYIKLQDGNVFSAVNPQLTANSLSNAPPAAFGFLGENTKNNGLFKIENSTISSSQEGKAIDIVARGITILNNDGQIRTNLESFFGDVRLIAVKVPIEVSLLGNKDTLLPTPILIPDNNNAGDINFSAANIQIFSSSPRKLSIWGGNVNLFNNTTILMQDLGLGTMSNERGVDIHANSLLMNGESTIDISTNGLPANINITTTGKFEINNGVVRASSGNPNNPSNIFIKTGSDLIIQDTGTIDSAFPGSGVAKAGTITVESRGNIKLSDGGSIRALNQVGEGSVGNINLNAKEDIVLTGDQSQILTGTESKANAGDINIHAIGSFAALNGSRIDSGTSAEGNGGNIDIKANNIQISESRIDAKSQVSNAGNPGSIKLVSQGKLQLNKGSISIQNDSVKNQVTKSSPQGAMILSSTEITLTDSQLTTQATGNQQAGAILLAFNNALRLENSFISTNAQNSSAGAIDINGDNFITLHDSAITTSVNGDTGNGGDISVHSDNLVLNTGLIQANTVANNASGGNINLGVKALISSGNQLVTGGDEPAPWQSGIYGNNVIQAAAPTGLSGTIRNNAPVLNLSGTLANLGNPQFDSNNLNWENCFSETASTLIRSGKGGLSFKANDPWVY